MIGDTDVDYRNTFWTAIIDASDDVIKNSAELMRRTSVVEDQPVAVDQQTELSGVRIVGAVEPYVEVNWYVIQQFTSISTYMATYNDEQAYKLSG